MEEGGCECHVRRGVVPFQRGMRELVFSLYFHLKCSTFRARTRPNLHSTLQFSSPTPCDSSPLHDSPRANSLTIRSSHFAPPDHDPIRTTFRLPPIVVLASFLKVSATRRFSIRIASRRRRIFTPTKRRKDTSAYC